MVQTRQSGTLKFRSREIHHFLQNFLPNFSQILKVARKSGVLDRDQIFFKDVGEIFPKFIQIEAVKAKKP